MALPCKKSGLIHLPFTLSIFFFSSHSTAEIHGSVAALSEYLGKGYSKSNGDFSALANIDYQHVSGFYSGVNAAYVNFGEVNKADSAHVEITPYLGWSFSLPNDWRLDGQWSRYLYDGKIFGQQADYNEFSLFLNFRDILSANVSFSENFYQRGHAAANYEITGRYPLTDVLDFSIGTGYTQAKQTLEYDYLYWNAGLSCYYQFIAFDLRYVNATATARKEDSIADHSTGSYADPIRPTLFFSVSAGF